MRNVYELKVTSKTENLKTIGEFIENALKREAIKGDIINEILIAADEAATNIIMHSYKKDPSGYIRVKLVIEKERIVVSLFDNGVTFDPASITPPDLSRSLEERKLGGLGIFLMKKFMDEVTYFFKNSNSRKENEVRMIKYLK